jgi:hypothetical protein
LVYLVVLHEHFPLLPSLQQIIDVVAFGVVVTRIHTELARECSGSSANPTLTVAKYEVDLVVDDRSLIGEELVVSFLRKRYDYASSGSRNRSRREGLARVESQEYVVFSLDDQQNVGFFIHIAMEIFLVQRIVSAQQPCLCHALLLETHEQLDEVLSVVLLGFKDLSAK